MGPKQFASAIWGYKNQIPILLPRSVSPTEQKIVKKDDTSSSVQKPEQRKMRKRLNKQCERNPLVDKVVFKVQIWRVQKMFLNCKNFKGLNNISKESFNSFVRYLYGENTIVHYATD